MFVSRWTVDYGDGPHPVFVPHAWGQEVSVEWEGPAVYRAEIDVPRAGGTLRFWGVSYAAEVYANGDPVARHQGIWDAFDVPLPGGKVDLEVRVTKNGGATYPVETVASGGLPHLFHTFGGIYREVELLETDYPLVLPPPERRAELPYVRGIVHRGWYPDLGYPNPDEHVVRREIREIKALGFNTIKFCGWVPPHRYLDVLEAEGMLGWLELPQGGSDFDPSHTEAIFAEVERVVLQYRRHACLAIWTLGELFWIGVPDALRNDLTETVRALTGAPWIADAPSGQLGTFDPIVEDPELATVDAFLDSLNPGPRDRRPLLLDGFAKSHVHRDLARLGDELPFWASSLPELNAHGNRLGMDLWRKLERSRFANEPTKNGHKTLMTSSRRKEAFVRKTMVEAARARAAWVDGYALAELRDTPVSAAGLFDDWGASRLAPKESAEWNGVACLFPIPRRQILIREGAVSLDPFNHFAGDVRLSLGLHTENERSGTLHWRIVDEAGRVVVRGAGSERRVVGAREVGDVAWPGATPGAYRLEAGFGATENAWDLWVVENANWDAYEGWRTEDSTDEGRQPLLPGGDLAVAFHRPVEAEGGVLFLIDGDEGTRFTTLWSESALEFQNDSFWETVPFRDCWSRLLPVSPNADLDERWLKATFGDFEVLLNRIDTSPHGLAWEHPLLVRSGRWIVTTLRPETRIPFEDNPAGCALVEALMRSL